MPFDAVAPNDLPDDPDQLVRAIVADPFVRQRMTAAMQALVEAAWGWPDRPDRSGPRGDG